MPVSTDRLSQAGAPGRLRRSTSFCIAAAAIFASACVDAAGSAASPLLRELARHAGARSLSAMLSTSIEHRPCLESGVGSEDFPTCALPPATPTFEMLDLAARISDRISRRADAETLHAAGLTELLWGGGTANSLDQAISYLGAATRLADAPASAFADLSGAYLARAERSHAVGDLIEALEAGSRAVEAEPENRAARFNLALSLERLFLRGEAAEEWRNYLALDSSSKWADEARSRLEKLETRATPIERPERGAGRVELRRFAAASPHQARLFGWDEVLGDWGNAVMRGDHEEAARLLGVAEILGSALVEQDRDATLLDAVEAIRSHPARSSELLKLARAHHAFARGRSDFAATRYDSAREALLEGVRIRAPSAALQGWLQVYSLFLSGSMEGPGAALPSLEALKQRVDSTRYFALAGQTAWASATFLARIGAYERSIVVIDDAIRWFTRAGEALTVGELLALRAEIQFAAGARLAANQSMRAALAVLDRHPPNFWTSNLLKEAARGAAADGLTRAALRMQNEGLRIVARFGLPMHEVMASLNRAEILAAIGDTLEAAEDLRRGAAAIGRMEDGFARDWMQLDQRLALASLQARRNPSRTVASLDSVLSGAGVVPTRIHLLRSYVARADAQLELGKTREAMMDLDSATSMLQEQWQSIDRTPLRLSLIDATQAVFDRLIMLAVNTGDAEAALNFLERSRSSFSAAADMDPASARAALNDEIALQYAVIGDTILTGVVRAGQVRMVRSTIDRRKLARTIERVRSGLEIGSAAEATRADLATLHEWLIRPIQEQIGGPGARLVILTDGELAGTPFAALFDAESGRYLIEDRSIRFSGSLADAAAPVDPRRAPTSAVIVAGPARARSGGEPAFSRLPGAQKEVEAIAPLYPRSRTLRGTTVTRSRLTSNLTSSEVFHFAGHAIFDDRSPENSYLVVDPDDPSSKNGRITAAEMEEMDLSSVRLVVLSACETMRSHAHRSGGFAGFAAALLRAGADGVIGSMWRVEDEVTRTFMVAFHREYARSGDSSTALRAAQLHFLRSADPSLSAPAAWAAFRYAGH